MDSDFITNYRNCIAENIKQNKCFVAYLLPNSKSKDITFFECEYEILANYRNLENKSGFLFAPFNTKKHNIYLLSAKPCTKSYNDSIFEMQKSTSKLTFTRNVDKIIAGIKDNKFKKIVLSKIFTTKTDNDVDACSLFFRMSDVYVNTFRYLVNIPGQGMWLGASPEPLLIKEKNKVRTISLAGTRKVNGNNNFTWSDKEIQEQAIVTNYIKETLIHQKVDNLVFSEPQTIKAGNLFHIKTDFEFEVHTGNTGQIIESLHPTPSICGFPKKEAFNLIQEIEEHDREYYSGILGPVNTNGNTHIFVNLRCIKINKNTISYFSGAGITEKSIPSKEWEETEYKIDTIRNIINN